MAIIQTIAATECIGNSLPKINSNFKNLNTDLVEVDKFRLKVNNLGAGAGSAGVLIKSANGSLSAAVAGVDYSRGTSTLATGLLKNTSGTLSIAISGADYFVPGSTLVASRGTFSDVLSAKLECFLGTTVVNGDFEATGKAMFGAGGLKTNNAQSIVDGDLEVINNGQIYSNLVGIVASPSDRDLKTNIVPILNPLEKLQQINGVTFDWNSGTRDVGVIAQEIKEVLPWAVNTTGQHMTVYYDKIIPLLIESIKELKREVDYLRSML